MPILLISGAIDLRKYNVPFTWIVNLEERLEQYIHSIQYAIDNYSSITKIIFCENTDYDYDYTLLTERALSKGKDFEYLTFQGDYDKIQKLGKGYGEGEIIKYALDFSRLLRTESTFYKLTGRIVVKNMDQVVKTTIYKNAFIFKQKDITNKPFDYIETYFYKAETDLYIQYLLNSYKFCNDYYTQYLEHVFYKNLCGLPLRCFNIQPIFSGKLGTSGELYDKSSTNMLIEKLYFGTGIYNLKKTIMEDLFMKIWTRFLIIKRIIGITNTNLRLFKF